MLYARHADTQRYPASLTKMMTLYLVFDALDSGKLTLDQKLPVWGVKTELILTKSLVPVCSNSVFYLSERGKLDLRV